MSQYVRVANNLQVDIVFYSKNVGGSDTTNTLSPGNWVAFSGSGPWTHCIGIHTVAGSTSGGHYPSSVCLDRTASVLVSADPSGISVTSAVPNQATHVTLANG